jgi:hypothetical protein
MFCFKFRNKIGMDAVLEALRACLKTRLCFERFHFEFALRGRSLEGNQTILVWHASMVTRPSWSGAPKATGLSWPCVPRSATVFDLARPRTRAGSSGYLVPPCCRARSGVFRTGSYNSSTKTTSISSKRFHLLSFVTM